MNEYRVNNRQNFWIDNKSRQTRQNTAQLEEIYRINIQSDKRGELSNQILNTTSFNNAKVKILSQFFSGLYFEPNKNIGVG